MSDFWMFSNSGGAPTAVSDDFNRANGGLGANWTTVTGRAAPAIGSNKVDAGGSDDAWARWSANTFNSNQYSECEVAALGAAIADYLAGPIVRVQESANTYYVGSRYYIDDGEGYPTPGGYRIHKCVDGTVTQIATVADTTSYTIWRLEASGTTITLKGLSTHGGSATTITSVTDSAISGGSAGLGMGFIGPTADNWYGGDL